MNKNLPAKSVATIRELLESDDVQREVKRALPGALSVEQLTRAMITLFRTNEKLLDCSQLSLLACYFGCAQLGLTPEPWLGQAYLVPFWNSKLQCNEATLIPGYRGLITLSRRSGFLENVEAKAVYQNEYFDIQFGSDPHLIHKPVETDPGDLRGAWTKWLYKSGHSTFDYMPLWEVDKIMERTKSRNRNGDIVGPWITDKPEMAKKSIIRRHYKLQPISVEDKSFSTAIAAENMALELGPGAQRSLFLPEETPLTAGGDIAAHEEFENAVGKKILTNPKFSEFMAITAKANKKSLVDTEISALENIDAFKAAFEKWLNQQSGQDEAEFVREWNFIRDPVRYEKYVADNLDRFDRASDKVKEKAQDKYERIVKKPWPKPAPLEPEVLDQGDDEKTSSSSSELVGAGESGNGVEDFDALVQSNKWQEMSALKEQFPAIFKDVTGGQVPRTSKGVNDVIDKMNAEIDKLNQ